MLAATAYAALFAALIPLGEVGFSLMPVLFLPLLFLIPYLFTFDECPIVLKIRYHIGLAILVFLIPGAPREFAGCMLHEYGWWCLPFNALIIFLIVPAVLLALQLKKHECRTLPNIALRIGQIEAIWFPVAMLLIARNIGKMIPIV